MRTDSNFRSHARTLVATCFSVALLTAAPTSLLAQTRSADEPKSSTLSAPVPSASTLSVPGIVADAVHDFKNVPSWTNVAILAAGGLGAAVGHSSDAALTRTLSGSPTMSNLFSVGERVGGARSQLAAALGTYAIGKISGQTKIARVGADLIQSQILAQTMTAAIKMSVRRTRPDGTEYSFPSGHSSVTFATATVLPRDLGWKAGIPAYALATYVAASRIQDKRHFLSDVTFGAAIGIVAGRSVTVGHGDAKFAVAPSAAPGGGGVSFTWLGSSH
jgi:membrane-associated phospholipid phosphatase